MSHHLDSPLSRQDPRLNLADQFVFGTTTATVLVLDTNSSAAGADKPRGFHPDGRYEFRIHFDGEAHESLTFRFQFDVPDARGVQAFVLSRLHGGDASRDDAAGDVLARGCTGEVVSGPGGVRVYAGGAHDPFFLDLNLLKAVDTVIQHGEDVPLMDVSASAANSFADATVDAIVLEIPHSDVEVRPGRHIGVWGVTRLATDDGRWRQINRIGLPMVWPIFRDDASDGASRSNETNPADDHANYFESLTTMIATAVRVRNTSADPTAYGQRVALRLTPDVMKYQVGTPAALDFSGFNGRSLSDNAPEVMFSLVTNSAVPTGLLATTSGPSTSNEFPYVRRI